MQEDRTATRTYDAPPRAPERRRVDSLDFELARFRGAHVPWADAETQRAIEAVV